MARKIKTRTLIHGGSEADMHSLHHQVNEYFSVELEFCVQKQMYLQMLV